MARKSLQLRSSLNPRGATARVMSSVTLARRLPGRRLSKNPVIPHIRAEFTYENVSDKGFEIVSVI